MNELHSSRTETNRPSMNAIFASVIENHQFNRHAKAADLVDTLNMIERNRFAVMV
jgi:hypothetical protein